MAVMGCQVHAIRKAIRPLFTDSVTIMASEPHTALNEKSKVAITWLQYDKLVSIENITIHKEKLLQNIFRCSEDTSDFIILPVP